MRLGVLVGWCRSRWRWCAHADVDTNFANQLHGYGIYGPRDYDA